MSEETEKSNFSFLTLVYSLVSSAWAAMGKIPHPVTQKIERDLDQAKGSIDMLVMLKEKTRGNLSGHENKILGDALADLQLNYADEAAKGETAAGDKKEGPEIIIPPGAGGSGKGPEIIRP